MVLVIIEKIKIAFYPEMEREKMYFIILCLDDTTWFDNVLYNSFDLQLLCICANFPDIFLCIEWQLRECTGLQRFIFFGNYYAELCQLLPDNLPWQWRVKEPMILFLQNKQILTDLIFSLGKEKKGKSRRENYVIIKINHW